MSGFRPHKAPTAKQLQKICDDFNRDYPIGAPLTLRKDSGRIQTIVRAPAQVLGGHSAVAWFAGVSGAYSIEDGRVSPAAIDLPPLTA